MIELDKFEWKNICVFLVNLEGKIIRFEN